MDGLPAQIDHFDHRGPVAEVVEYAEADRFAETAAGTYFHLANLFVQSAAAQPAAKSLDDDVIIVGHSLVDPLIYPLQHLVEASGGRGRIWAHTIPGAPLEINWKDAHLPHVEHNARALLPEGETEVLVITERVPVASPMDGHDSTGYALLFHDLAVTSNPAARTYLYESWTDLRSGTDRQDEDWIGGDPDRGIPWRERLDIDRARWEEILTYVNANRAEGSTPMQLIPAGRAIARLHDELASGLIPDADEIRDFFADDIHLNDIGAYFVTLVHYATIYGRSPIGLPAAMSERTTPSPALALKLQELAWETVLEQQADSGN